MTFIIRKPYGLFSSSFSSPYKKNIALCKEATSFERREYLASPYANVSHRLMRISRMPRCEGLAPLGAKVLHRSVRRSCTARCEGLALLGANVSHASVRMSRMPRCECLACLDARGSKSLFFLVFLFCPKYVSLIVMKKKSRLTKHTKKRTFG